MHLLTTGISSLDFIKTRRKIQSYVVCFLSVVRTISLHVVEIVERFQIYIHNIWSINAKNKQTRTKKDVLSNSLKKKQSSKRTKNNTPDEESVNRQNKLKVLCNAARIMNVKIFKCLRWVVALLKFYV